MLLEAVSRFEAHLERHGIRLTRQRPEILQINTGKLCNLTCMHCHVNAGPKRKEIITRATIDRILEWLAPTDIPTVDLTGGAPEMILIFATSSRKRSGRGGMSSIDATSPSCWSRAMRTWRNFCAIIVWRLLHPCRATRRRM